MSLDGYIAGPNDAPGNPGGDGFMRLHEWFSAPEGKFFRPSGPAGPFLQKESVVMGRKLYVGNLPYQTGEAELTELFSRAGTVESARIMRDMATGRARGFGFVEMATDEEAQRAITELNEFKMEGRALVVNEARPKPMGGGGGGFGGDRGGRGGGGGGGNRREPRW